MTQKTVSLVINKVRLTRRFVIIDYHNGSASLSVSLSRQPKGEPVIPVKKSRKKKEPAESVAE